VQNEAETDRVTVKGFDPEARYGQEDLADLARVFAGVEKLMLRRGLPRASSARRAGRARDRARGGDSRGACGVSHRGQRRRKPEGHNWLRIDFPEGGRHVGIPRAAVN